MNEEFSDDEIDAMVQTWDDDTLEVVAELLQNPHGEELEDLWLYLQRVRASVLERLS